MVSLLVVQKIGKTGVTAPKLIAKVNELCCLLSILIRIFYNSVALGMTMLVCSLVQTEIP